MVLVKAAHGPRLRLNTIDAYLGGASHVQSEETQGGPERTGETQGGYDGNQSGG